MEILIVIMAAIVLVAIGIAGMAIQILFKKEGKFPNTHVSGNRYLKSQGVYCSQTQDKLEQRNAWRQIEYNRLTFVQDIKTGK